uniref:Uncharacterized protein n=1 Tax=Aegilops tauschii subsp. strangulata TaxID=200361 RepID=A0A453SAP4_AEGTS
TPAAVVERATLVAVVVADTPVAGAPLGKVIHLHATTLPTPWARQTSAPLAGTSRVAPSLLGGAHTVYITATS